MIDMVPGTEPITLRFFLRILDVARTGAIPAACAAGPVRDLSEGCPKQGRLALLSLFSHSALGEVFSRMYV